METTKKWSELTELEKIERTFEQRKSELIRKDFWMQKLGFKPSHVGSLYNKETLSFEVSTLHEAKVISDSFPEKVNANLRTAGDSYLNASPFYVEFKTWQFNRSKETVIHFETETEYIDIKIPFSVYPTHLLSSTETMLEGKELDSAILHRQRRTFDTFYFSGFDHIKFYGGSVKSYVKPESLEDSPEILEQFEKTIFQLQ